YLRSFHKRRRQKREAIPVKMRILESAVTFVRPKLVLTQQAACMHIEWRPSGFRKWPFLSSFPFPRSGYENSNGGLVHYSSVNPLQPMIKPAQRFVLILVN